MLDRFAKFGRGAFDPVVHGVKGYMLWRAFDLLENAALQARRDVGQKNVLRIEEFFGTLWIEIGEDVQFSDQRFAFIKVFGIFPRPEERFTGSAFESRGIDFAAFEDGRLLFRKIHSIDAGGVVFV